MKECKHVPDLPTVGTEYEKGTVYVFVYCVKCGKRGEIASITQRSENIDWS
jgi:hypothetical protein